MCSLGSTSAGGHERRRFPRYPFRRDVEFQWGAQVLRGTTRVISLRGMFLEYPDPLWVGASFSARVLVDEPIRVDCVVRMIEPGRGMGVEFLEPTEETCAQLKKLVEKLAGDTAIV